MDVFVHSCEVCTEMLSEVIIRGNYLQCSFLISSVALMFSGNDNTLFGYEFRGLFVHLCELGLLVATVEGQVQG